MKRTDGTNQSDTLYAMLADCALCPRNCHVNRLAGQRGYCGQTARLKAARAALHFWEEPCISGTAGSGAVFFSGCPLRCLYCQNHDIAVGKAGREITPERLSEIFLELQEKGANNINLVTPTHFVPLIVPALEDAKRRGLRIPVVYNTSSYEKVDTLRLLEGLVDIYLPDFKYESQQLSGILSHAPDYFETAKAAVAEMVRQTGEPRFLAPDGRILNARQMNEACGEEGNKKVCAVDNSGDREAVDADFLMIRGVIVRHLALPGQGEDSRRVLHYLLETYGNRIYISIMNQYTPMPAVIKNPCCKNDGEKEIFRALARRLKDSEYESLINDVIENGIENGFLQEGETAAQSFIPAFNGEGL